MAPIPEHLFRGLTFEAMREPDWHQWLSLRNAFGSVAIRRGLYAPQRDSRSIRLETADEERLRSFVWQLVAQGVLTIGMNEGNAAWPFLSLTDLGHKVIRHETSSLPYDTSGYIAEVKQRDTSASDVVLQAIGEATDCLSKGSLWAATMMLGVASEATIRDLIEAYAGALSSADSREKFERATTGPIRRSFEELERRLSTRDLPSDLRENQTTFLTSVFDLIRLARNDAGHPKVIPTSDAATVHARLILFLEYARFIGDLKTWLRSTPQ